MKCKYCDAALEEGMTVCPVCGKEQEIPEEPVFMEEMEQEIAENEETEVAVEETAKETLDQELLVEEAAESEVEMKPGIAWWKAALMIAGLVIAAVVLLLVILKSQGVDINPAHWFDKSESQDAIEDSYKLNRDDYTAAADDVEGQAAKIAGKSGDVELNNAQLQVYYWNGVYEFINNYQYYLEGLGLDLSKPFNEQKTVNDTTWQNFFLENAIFNWHKFSALVHEAEESGFTLREETVEQLEQLEQDMDAYAKSSGYDSDIDMLRAEMGELVTMEAYMQYCRDYYTAMEFFNAEYEKMQPTDQEIEAYFEENQSSLGITKQVNAYDVRHILIEPEGGTVNEDGTTKTYTDIEWGDCQAKAQALLDQWKNGDATEDSFALLAKTHSADGGSSENGGLYADLNESTNFVQEFKDWYLDESRKAGDTGLVKSVYGYHIMYFSGVETVESDWKQQCSSAITQKMSEKYVNDLMKKWPVKLFDKDIAIGEVTLKTQ